MKRDQSMNRVEVIEEEQKQTVSKVSWHQKHPKIRKAIWFVEHSASGFIVWVGISGVCFGCLTV
jgi:hypothetical protein